MSNGKKMIALVLATFIALIVVGAVWSGKGGDTTGANTGTAADVIAAQGLTGDTVPPSQVGINAVANEAGHLHVAVNFTWLLMTGFLVLFMQVGFAFLVTGLTRAKNAGHMMMMNIAAFAIALHRLLRGRASPSTSAASARSRTSVASVRSTGCCHTATAGLIGLARVLPAERPRLRRRRDGAVPVPGRVHGDRRLHHHRRHRRADLVRRLHRRRARDGRAHLPDLRQLGLGRRLAGQARARSCTWGHGAVDFAGSGVVHATGGWAALALAMVLGPRIGKFNKDGTPNAFPGHNLGYVVIGTMILLFGWMGFNPGSTFGATDLRISIVAVNTLLVRVLRLRRGDGLHERTLRQARHLDVVQRHARRPRRHHGTVRVRRAVGGVDHRHRRRAARVLRRLVLRSRRSRRRPVRRDLGPRHQRRVGRARASASSPTAPTASGWNGISGNVKGLLYGDAGQFMAQVAHVVVGFIWAWGITWLIFSVAKRFMKMRVSPEVELARPRHARVRHGLLSGLPARVTR